MSETKEQDNHYYIEIFIKYKESNYDPKFIENLNENDKNILNHTILHIANSFGIECRKNNIDTICKFIIAISKAINAEENKQYFLTKEKQVFNFLCSKIILNSIIRNEVKHNYYNIIDFIDTSSNNKIQLDNNKKCKIERLFNIQYVFEILLPYIYTEKEIASFANILKEIKNPNEKLKYLNDFVTSAKTKFQNEYKNRREFAVELEQKIKNANFLRFASPIAHRIIKKFIVSQFEFVRFYILEFEEEYKKWKADKFIYPANCHIFLFFFGLYYWAIDNGLLYSFFNTLNEPHAFDHNQIDYIREMAPKLRISSYLNEEYAKYKKWYNPAARDFDFGEDEAEEATVISKDHLKRLSHFEEEKLTNLLEKLKENQYIAENTRPKDWLFAFGMSGDEKPEFFKKIQWIGRSSVGISPTYFTDFIGILGYDLNKIYFEKPKITISILNNCFMTTDKPIDQNSFKREKGEFIPTPKHKKMAKLVKECGLLTE